MAVFRWGQNWGSSDLEREVDRLLNSVNMTFQGLRFGRQYPPVNIYELDSEYVLTAELPGVAVSDMELTVANGVLTISGTRQEEAPVPESQFRRQERPRGRWQRSLSIPERVLEEELSAELTNGILKIRLPKATETTARQIPVVEG
jgi:HSP20 family protein